MQTLYYDSHKSEYRSSDGEIFKLEDIQDQIDEGRIIIKPYVKPESPEKTWLEGRTEEYAKVTPQEQIEMIVDDLIAQNVLASDGNFRKWYSSVKTKYPKS